MAIMLNKKTTDKFLKKLCTASTIAKLSELQADVKIGGGHIAILHEGVVTVQADLKSNAAMAVVLDKCSQSVIDGLASKVDELLSGFYDYHHYNIAENLDINVVDTIDAGVVKAKVIHPSKGGFQLEGTETGHIDVPEKISDKVAIADAELIGCEVSGTNSSSIYYAVVVESNLKIAVRIKKNCMVSIRVYFKCDISEIIQAMHLTKSGNGTHLMSTHLKCKNVTEVVGLIGALYFVVSTFYGANSMLPVNLLLDSNNIDLPSTGD